MTLPRLQLHLSTCLALMFVAGGLLWANCHPRTIFLFGDEKYAVGYEYGWPTTLCIHNAFPFPRPDADEVPVTMLTTWRADHILLNALIAALILAAAALIIEWLLHRSITKR